eukprot:8868735-Ditylum_brightwellii.AAC.1
MHKAPKELMTAKEQSQKHHIAAYMQQHHLYKAPFNYLLDTQSMEEDECLKDSWNKTDQALIQEVVS